MRSLAVVRLVDGRLVACTGWVTVPAPFAFWEVGGAVAARRCGREKEGNRGGTGGECRLKWKSLEYRQRAGLRQGADTGYSRLVTRESE